MITLFWCCFVFVLYTYVGYPALAWLASRLRPAVPPAGVAAPAVLPRVRIIIAVHDEERNIPRKLENLAQLDYPPELLSVTFVSDGSTDSTDRLIEADGRADLLSYPQRLGKANALNLAVRHADDDVLVFCDVRQWMTADAVRLLVAALTVPGIGVVSGELVHTKPGSRQAASIGLYWRYERFLRHAECRWKSTVGTTGALYAIRRRDFRPLRVGTILDDFEIPMHIVRGGRRAIIEPRAVIYDELQVDSAGERRRKIRTLSGNFQSFARNLWLFSPLSNPLWLQFISHKVFRLLVPYALFGLLVCSWLIPEPSYRAFALLQTAAYVFGCTGLAYRPLRETRLGSLCTVVLELNLAAVTALWVYGCGQTSARWEKT